MCLVRLRIFLHAFPVYLISLVIKATLVVETDSLKGLAQLVYFVFIICIMEINDY